MHFQQMKYGFLGRKPTFLVWFVWISKPGRGVTHLKKIEPTNLHFSHECYKERAFTTIKFVESQFQRSSSCLVTYVEDEVFDTVDDAVIVP